MTERTVPKEFNDANIAAARRFKAERDALITALRRIRSLEEKNVPKYAQQIASAALDRVALSSTDSGDKND